MTSSVLVISTSLNDISVSRWMAESTYQALKRDVDVVTFCDLRAYPLPHCNGLGQSAFSDPHVKVLSDMIAAAGSLVIASPIYNYSISSPTKNLFELTTSAWKSKFVGLLFGSGTPNSFLAGMPFIQSLIMDGSCLVCPRFVMAQQADIPNGVATTKLADLLEEFTKTFVGLHKKLG